jgi:NADH:ubiquinone oxidoreductase subunit 5 (subunit L)/multisubunit Na+/H+ antiporter MnhA subunit
MPITAVTMLLATLAISGVPIFSGFYSKDAVLAAVVGHVEHHAADLLLLVFMVVGATLTAFYMFRMWLLLFTGTSRSAGHAAATPGHDQDHDHQQDHDHGDPVAHAHESPKIMTVPLIALAVPTVLVGLPLGILPIVGGTPILENMLAYGAPVPLEHHAGAVAWTALGLSLLIAGIGIATAFAFYFWRVLDPAAAARRLGSAYVFFKNKWYFDELYDRVFVQPVLWVGRRFADLDRNVIDGFLDGTARATADFSRLNGGFDLAAIDGAVNAVGRVTYTIGDWGRRLQTGHLRSYLMVLAVGLVVLFLGIARWIQTPG